MSLEKAELIIHPVRLRILQVLSGDPLTTQEIAQHLSSVPVSSLYRHLRLLLQSDLVAISEVRLVKGIQEKVYELAQQPLLTQGDIVAATSEDHLRFFTTNLMTLLQDFSGYVEDSTELDLGKDRAEYSESAYWADTEDLVAFQTTIEDALTLLIQNKKDVGRRKYKLALVMHPLANKVSDNE
jgi:DNA-binding transcriptional ArsR family regulator